MCIELNLSFSLSSRSELKTPEDDDVDIEIECCGVSSLQEKAAFSASFEKKVEVLGR